MSTFGLQLTPSYFSASHEHKKISKVDWQSLKQLVAVGDVQKLGRTPQDLEVYHNSMAKVRQEWRTADDYILHKIFGFPDAKEDDGKRFVVLPPQEKETLIFTPNDFPYSKEESIQQDLIWSTKPLTKDQVERMLRQHRPSDQWEVVWFENPPNLKSVKNVHHVHVFSVPLSGATGSTNPSVINGGGSV